MTISKDEIERMKKEAEAHADEDKKKQESVEVRNIAESMIYTAEKALRDQGDKIPADIKKDVEEKIAELKKVKDLPAPGGQAGGTDTDAIKKATEALSLAMQKIGESMAKAQTNADATQADAEKKSDQDGTPGGTVHDV